MPTLVPSSLPSHETSQGLVRREVDGRAGRMSGGGSTAVSLRAPGFSGSERASIGELRNTPSGTTALPALRISRSRVGWMKAVGLTGNQVRRMFG
jgi:hypothetical protein